MVVTAIKGPRAQHLNTQASKLAAKARKLKATPNEAMFTTLVSQVHHFATELVSNVINHSVQVKIDPMTCEVPKVIPALLEAINELDIDAGITLENNCIANLKEHPRYQKVAGKKIKKSKNLAENMIATMPVAEVRVDNTKNAAKKMRPLGIHLRSNLNGAGLGTGLEEGAELKKRRCTLQSKFARVRYIVMKATGAYCSCCGATIATPNEAGQPTVLSGDHVLDFSSYPHLRLNPFNVQILCEGCNVGKGSWDHTDWRQPSQIRALFMSELGWCPADDLEMQVWLNYMIYEFSQKATAERLGISASRVSRIMAKLKPMQESVSFTIPTRK